VLWIFAGMAPCIPLPFYDRPAFEHEMAVLTVIAYYFERFDIFEEPRG